MKKFLLAVLSLTIAFAAMACADSGKDSSASRSEDNGSVSASVSSSDESSSDESSSDESSSDESSSDESSSDESSSDESSSDESSSDESSSDESSSDESSSDESSSDESSSEESSNEENSSGDDSSSVEHQHVTVKTKAKAATCTEDGNIAYWTCSECGKLFSDEACAEEITLVDTVITATGHKGVKTEAKAATCTQDGNIAYWTCSECGKLFSGEACTEEITLADTVITATGEHTFDSNGDCEHCSAKATDKALYLNEVKNATVAYGEKGWKISVVDKVGEANYTVALNKEITAWNIAQGKTLLTITFGGSFDGTTYEGRNPVNCTKWIVPAYAEAKMDGEGNLSYDNWNYNAGFISQLTDNGDGTYTATIDLTDATYDFSGKAIQLCVNVKDVNEVDVGDCYVTDITYWGAPTAEEYIVKNSATSTVVYDESADTYTINGTTDATYFKISARVISYWIEQGYVKADLYFKNTAESLTSETWKQVHFHSTAMCEQGVHVAVKDVHAGIMKPITLADYKDTGIYFFTDRSTACDLLVKITLSDGKLVKPEESEWVQAKTGCTVAYTDGKGWKITATGTDAYDFKITKETIAYYVSEGMSTLKITFGGSFDGTNHAGAPVNCTKWIIPTPVDSSVNGWEYNAGFISGLISNGDNNTYYATIDLTDATYDFVNYDLDLHVNYADVGNNAVGACYIYGIEFSK